MGKFIYEGVTRVEVEDRALQHLQLVITAKLRRGEPFSYSWRDDHSLGEGKTTVWIHPHSAIVFKYFGSRLPSVNPAWVDALAYTANSATGLYLVHEPVGNATTGNIGTAPAT